MEDDKIKEYLNRPKKPLLIGDVLLYEINSHWFASKVSNVFLQELLGRYFAWKVTRKYRRYTYNMEMRSQLKPTMSKK
jgi:hypothetical protein